MDIYHLKGISWILFRRTQALTEFDLISKVRSGFPLHALDNLADALEIRVSQLATELGYNRRHMYWLRQQEKLSRECSEKLYRVANLLAVAHTVFGFSEGTRWLLTQQPLFQNETPIQIANTEFGAHYVLQVLKTQHRQGTTAVQPSVAGL